MYAVPMAYLNIYFGEVFNTGIRVIFLSIVSSYLTVDNTNDSNSWVQFLRVMGPLGLLAGATWCIVFGNFNIKVYNGLEITALNWPGIFSALLWIVVFFVALFTDFSTRTVDFYEKSSLLTTGETCHSSASQINEKKGLIEQLSVVFRSLELLCRHRSFLALYFNYFILSFAHVLLILMLVYYGSLPALVYGIVDVVSVALVTYLAKFSESSNGFFIVYGLHFWD